MVIRLLLEVCPINVIRLFPYIGVYLSLKGKVYANNSIIPIAEIGETDTSVGSTQNNGLQCITDKMPCCMGTSLGEWTYHKAPVQNTTTNFFVSRGLNNGAVNLNRLNNNVTSPTGQFCCMVPDTDDDIQTLCVSIGK